MNHADKILVALFELSRERTHAISYEDLVVAAYKLYPDDFSLRGYPQYPDASDIHKPIYNHLRPQGLVRVSQKTFVLTDAGKAKAELLLSPDASQNNAGRLSRSESQAKGRYLASDAARLVRDESSDDLIDTDSQRFYGFAAWSKPRDAAARREEFLTLLAKLREIGDESTELLNAVDQALSTKFGYLIGSNTNDDNS
jgi:hypothetical protein